MTQWHLYLFVTLENLVRIRLLRDLLGFNMLHATDVFVKITLQGSVNRGIVNRHKRRDKIGGPQRNSHSSFGTPGIS